MKIVISIFFVALLAAVTWVVVPQYLPSGTDASANVEVSNPSAESEAIQASLDDTDMFEVAGVQVALAKALPSQDDRAPAAEDGRSANGHLAAMKNGQGPGLNEGYSKSTIGNAMPRPILGCLIEPDQTAEVGSPVVGVIESIKVERGDRVTRGQVLAQLRANVERASVDVAQARTQAEADVRAAQTNVEFLRQKQARAEDLVAKKFISQQALEQARADTRLAEEKLAQAGEQQLIWQKELELASAQLQMRSIRAPFDGVIVDRYVTVGERIEEKPLFRIVKTDPLRVEMVAPAAMFGTVSAGTAVTVIPDLPSAPARPARVVLVDTFIDGASNTFRVRASLSNSDGKLPSGLRCRAELSELPVSAEAPMPAAPKSAVSQRERPSSIVGMVLKVDTAIRSMPRETTPAVYRVDPQATQN
ncbi:MAG: efflux RND transporter periplasmic adaptor subunit [Betaproteobacteria bacterium]